MSTTSFRPLAGIMVLIRRNEKAYYRIMPQVSVPLRGLWFLSIQTRIIEDVNDYDEFPSPCGDYGSYLRD